jgi:type IV pilus assembly protein PilE
MRIEEAREQGTVRYRQRGITLIELMVVVVVVAILASIAVPSYRNYMIRTQRTEARTALLQLQAAQEKFYLQNNRYTEDLVSAPADGGLGIGDLTSGGKYDIAVSFVGGDDQTYTAEATPHSGGGQDDDSSCTKLTIDNNGTRGAEGSGGVDGCWH